MLCRFADLPNRTVGGVTVAGDIRSYLRSCDTVNRGNYCEKEVNFNRETCYSTCRENYCNEFNGDQDWPTVVIWRLFQYTIKKEQFRSEKERCDWL